MNPAATAHSIAERLLCPKEFLHRLKRDFPGRPQDREHSVLPAAGPGLAPGQFFAGHTLLGRIGRGGMGEVWKAREDFTSRVVALKVMHPRLLEGRTPGDRLNALRRFRNEMETAANLTHRNLVPLYQAGEDEGRLFYTMEFVQGTNVLLAVRPSLSGDAAPDHDLASETSAGELRAATDAPDGMDRSGGAWSGLHSGRKCAGPTRWRLAAKHLEEAARGVAHAHRCGYLHRDLKPDNILVDASTGEARVTDFGLAKALDGREHSRSFMGQYRAGSRGYMSPEQGRDASQATIQSDVYSLGATLCALLTGQPPSRPARATDRLVDLTNREPVQPPPDLSAICLKCLQQEPEDRYGTALELADDLASYRELRPVWARPLSRLQRLKYWCRRRPRTATLSLLASFLGLSLLVGIPWAALALTAARYETRLEREQKLSAKLEAELAELAARQARANTLFQQARTSRERGDWAGVLELLDQAHQAGYSDAVQVAIEQAKAWRAMGNISRWARQVELLPAWQTEPRHAGTVLLLRAQLERFRGNQEPSTVLTQAALEHSLDPADDLYARASVAETTREAVALLRGAVRRDPFHYEATMMLVAGLHLSGLRAEAREHAGYARRLFPEDGGFPIWLAIVAASESNHESMEHWLAEAGQNLDPATRDLLAGLLGMYYSLAESLNDLDLDQPGWTAQSMLNLVQLAFRLRQLHHEAGQSHLGLASAARSLPPSFHRAFAPLFQLSTLRALLTQDFTSHIAALEQAARTHDEATLHFLRANLLADAERYAKAETAFLTAADLPAMIPGISREAVLGAAATANLIYRETENPEDLQRAAAHVRRRVGLGPAAPVSAELLLRIALRAEDYALCRTIITPILESAPQNLEWWVHLAEVELAASSYFAAIQAAQQVLSRRPDHPEARRITAIALHQAGQSLEAHGYRVQPRPP